MQIHCSINLMQKINISVSLLLSEVMMVERSLWRGTSCLCFCTVLVTCNLSLSRLCVDGVKVKSLNAVVPFFKDMSYV